MKRQALWLLLSGVLLMAGCAPVGTHPHPIDEMVQMVQGARTKADHEALAAHYEQDAKALREKEEQHKQILAAYEQRGIESVKGGMIQHCNYLIRTYHEAAEENLALARTHRQLALKAPPQ